MAVNRYDKPIASEFMNTYVPIPFQEMKEAVYKKQATHDDNLARLDALSAQVNQLNYIRNSEDEKYIKGTVMKDMEDLINRYSGKDLSDPTVYNALRSEFSSTFDKKRIKDIQDSYTNWATNEQNKAKLKAAGKWDDALDLEDPASGFDSRTGTYNHQSSGLLDVTSAAQSYFEPLTSNVHIDPKRGVVISGVDMGRIRDTADQGVRSFLDDPAGKQAVRIAAYRDGIDTKEKWEALQSTEEGKAIMEGYAHNILMEYGETFSNYQEKPISGVYGKGSGGDDSWINQEESTESTPMKSKVQPLKDPTSKKGLGQNSTANIFDMAGGATYQDETSPEEINSRQKALNDMRSKFNTSELKTLPDKKFIEIFNKAQNGLVNQSMQYTNILDDEIVDIISKELEIGIRDKNVILADSEGRGKTQKLTEVLDELDMTQDEYLEQIRDLKGVGIMQDMDEPGMYKINLKPKKGNSRTVYVSSHKGMQAATSGSHQLAANQRDLDETPVLLGTTDRTRNLPGAYRSVPNLSKDGVFTYDIQYGVIAPDGSFQYVGDVEGGLNTIKRAEIEGLKGSKIQGTNIDFLHLTKNSNPNE